MTRLSRLRRVVRSLALILPRGRGLAALVVRFVAFSGLLGVLFLVPVQWTLWRLGDNWSAGTLLAKTKGREYLFGSGYVQRAILNFKFDMLRLRPTAVVALGSSRVMQFRAWDFRAPPERRGRRTFYNAGAPLVGSPTTFLEFARRWPRPSPDLVLLGLDTWTMSGARQLRPFGARLEKVGLYQPARRCRRMVEEYWDRVTSQFYADQRLVWDLPRWWPLLWSGAQMDSGRLLIGAAARLSHSGFRPDGSYEYGAFASRYTGSGAVTGRVAIAGKGGVDQSLRRRVEPFAPEDHVGRGARGDLERALARLTDRGALVMIVLPPYSPYVVERIKRDVHQRAFLGELRGLLVEVARSHARVGFRDFTDPADAGCRPDEFYDAIHPSETCMARVSLKLAEDPEIRPYVDAERIRAYLGVAADPYFVFPPVRPSLDRTSGR